MGMTMQKNRMNERLIEQNKPYFHGIFEVFLYLLFRNVLVKEKNFHHLQVERIIQSLNALNTDTR